MSSGVEEERWHRFATEEWVYGTILVSGMIVVAGGDTGNSWHTFVVVVVTVVVFWAAHVYAGTVGAYGRHETTIRTAFARSFRRSLGLLAAALLPSIVLLLGALEAVPDLTAVWTALWLCVVILGVSGYRAFALRGSTLTVRILGALGTAALGLAMVVLKVFVH